MKTLTNTAPLQKGMTSLGWLFVISIIGFFALLIIKLLPIYLGNMEIRSVLEAMRDDSEIRNFDKREFRKNLAKRLTVSSWTSGIDTNTLQVKKNKNGTKTLSLNYEARENYAGNIFIVVAFENQVEIPRE